MIIDTQPTLIIGATGKTGSRVANQLEQLNRPIRKASRSSTIPFNWDDHKTWNAALEGVRAVYVTYFPDLAFPGAVEKVAMLAETARTKGVNRLVLLSGRGEHHARLGEEAIKNSGIDYTLIRSSWFAQNFSEGYLREPIMGGVLPMPGGNVAEPIIDIDDIADIAVAALTEENHSGKLYEVTGPELLTFAQMAEILAKTLGRHIQYIPIEFEDFHTSVAKAGGEFVADVFTAIARETLDGRNSQVCNGVMEALGRAPRSFKGFAQNAAQSGAWKLD
ncbi:MAG: NmrA family NAD(P)-binding protein [Lentilitoribacter sp.]